MIVKRGIGAAIVGVSIGLSGSFVAARWLESLVFEISPRDPAIIAAAAVVLLLVALGACYLPARRATNVDPVRALSVE